MSVPPIALTCGEPAGVGPEIAVKAWAAAGPDCPFFWIGDPRHLPGDVPVVDLDSPGDAATAIAAGRFPVLRHDFPAQVTPGTPDPANAARVVSAIERGVSLVRSGAASALTTGPINKHALQSGAAFAFPGHTEFLAHLAGVDSVAMMLACEALKVVPATIHIPLADVPGALTADGLIATLRLVHRSMAQDFAIHAPRIAVAGVNPHAGENGAMGREERDMIAPVLDGLRAEGMRLIGPLSADTMFHAAARMQYDVAVAMYHDQALIPIKTIDFSGGVNVTLGLPFVRTSPDHGTAFDIAGRGKADPTSLIAALRMARDMAKARAG